MRVRVNKGGWANQVITDKEFELVRGLSLGQKGPFITVNGTGVEGFPQRNFRIMLSSPGDADFADPSQMFAPGALSAFQASDAPHVLAFASTTPSQAGVASLTASETEEQILARLVERFAVLKEITTDVARGTTKALVVSGASGVGKSFEVEQALGKDSLMDKLSFDPLSDDQNKRRMARDGSFKPRYSIISGYMTPSALYQSLYDHSEDGEVMVVDDCDSILGNVDSLNLLKAALDNKIHGSRRISWKSSNSNTSSAPSQFVFKGGVILITNINFEKIVSRGTSPLAPHLEAIMSRSLYLDTTIDTLQEKLVRINYVVNELKMLESQLGLSPEEVREVMDWTVAHAAEFRELSLRKVGQLAAMRKGKSDWRRTATITLLRRR